MGCTGKDAGDNSIEQCWVAGMESGAESWKDNFAGGFKGTRRDGIEPDQHANNKWRHIHSVTSIS